MLISLNVVTMHCVCVCSIVGHAPHAQLCLTICNLMDCSLPVSSVHGILYQVHYLIYINYI